MADESAEPAPAGFPAALDACLREDACVRADAQQLRLKLEEARAAAEKARRGSALPGRLLAALGRHQGGPATPEEAAEIFAREKTLHRRQQESDLLVQHCTRELDTRLHDFLLPQVPSYALQSRARLRLAGWEAAIADLQADLRVLIKTLGQARNNAATGYDPGRHKVSATALELFERAAALIAKIEDRVRRANTKAAEIGGLPGVTMMPLFEAVRNLTKLDMAPLQLETDRLARELELFAQKQLADLQVPVVQAAGEQVAQARAYLEQYREQLRAHYTGLVSPEETARELPGILDRFRRGQD
jgi:hypothetical protein